MNTGNLWKRLIHAAEKGIFLISGPNVIESQEHALKIAGHVARVQQKVGIPIVFKASFDKANRTSSSSFRGPGAEEGLRTLEKVKTSTGLAVLTDIHESYQAEQVAAVVDVLQIPAFLCRQTDLLVAAARTGKIIHIKKGQFASPQAMQEQADKVRGAGNPHVMLCERGTTFGYEDLVVDPRSLVRMRRLTGLPVVLDVTHCLQRPSALPVGGGVVSGGDGSLVMEMGDVGAACGVSGLFVEVHDEPARAKCDALLQTRMDRLEGLARRWLLLAQAYKAAPHA